MQKEFVQIICCGDVATWGCLISHLWLLWTQECNCLPSFLPVTLSSIPYCPVWYLDFTKVFFDIRIQLAPFGEWVSEWLRPLAFCFLCQENVLCLQWSEQSSCVYLSQMYLGVNEDLRKAFILFFKSTACENAGKGSARKNYFDRMGLKEMVCSEVPRAVH